MFKNQSGQYLDVVAIADAGHASLDAGEFVTGDAANITCKVEQDDDGIRTAVGDTNPTELEGGRYRFTLTQAEVNGDKLSFYPVSATAGVQVYALPSSVINTRPPEFTDFNDKLETIQDLLEYEEQQTAATWSDTFTRSTINPDWTKSASNPLTAAGYGDPFVYHDGTNFNVFCDDLGTGNIVVFSSADPEVLGAASVALSVPSGFTYVRDPYVILDDGTYYLFFSHQLSSGATSSSIGIGVATSSTLTGPYTVQSTDLITRSSDSVNEPSVIRDGQYWKCYVTAGTNGTLDVGAEDIAYFSSANLLGPWQDCGNCIIEGTTPSKWQDQQVIKIGKQFVMLLNNGNADIVYSHSEDGHAWTTPAILKT